MAQEQYPQLETRLKNILQICVQTLKPRLKSKAQLAQLQDILIDYQNNDELSQIIENVVKMIQKIYTKIVVDDQIKNMVEEQEYKKLQESLQMLESRQRLYIKSQNQLKLYCQELQVKVKQLEQSKNELVVSTKKVILDLKRQNQALVQKIKSLAVSNNKQGNTSDKNNENYNYKVRYTNGNESAQRLPKQLKNNDKVQNSLRSKLQQYQQVIQSIEQSRGKKYATLGQFHRQKIKNQVK